MESTQTASPKSAREAIQGQVAEVYGKHPFPQRTEEGTTLINERFKQKLELLGLPVEQFRGKRVLDGGCGTGELACFMASNGAQVTGVEITKESVEYGRKLAQAKGLSVDFRCGSLMDVSLEPESFDIIYLHMSPPCIGNLPEAVRIVCRALKPGGYLYICPFTKWGKMLFSEVPHWKYLLVRWLGKNDPDRCIAIGEKLFYKPGMERKHGLPKNQYLADAWGIPFVNLNTYGEVLRWLKENDLEYRSSYPAMEFSKFVAPWLDPSRQSSTRAGRIGKGLFRAVLTVLPIHRLSVMQRPSWWSRAACQTILLFTGCHAMFNVLGRKRARE